MKNIERSKDKKIMANCDCWKDGISSMRERRGVYLKVVAAGISND